jgi:hypothetical protein
VQAALLLHMGTVMRLLLLFAVACALSDAADSATPMMLAGQADYTLVDRRA